MRTLYAGPWVGEFGWELCWWNPFLRKLAKNYDRIIVSGPGESEYLYEFADQYISLKVKSITYIVGKLLEPDPQVDADTIVRPIDVFKYQGVEEFLRQRRSKIMANMEWKNLGNADGTKRYDVLYAFRPPKSYQGKLIPGKEYPKQLCNDLIKQLLDAGLSLCCYGDYDNYYVDGTDDIRGQPLVLQCGLLARAKCAVGPSSGTIHLASLCGCPHITWYAGALNLKKRYETEWNPLNTSVCFVCHGRFPSPNEVVQRVKALSCVEQENGV